MSLPEGTRESQNFAASESLRPLSMLLRPTVPVPSELTGNEEILRIERTTISAAANRNRYDRNNMT